MDNNNNTTGNVNGGQIPPQQGQFQGAPQQQWQAPQGAPQQQWQQPQGAPQQQWQQPQGAPQQQWQQPNGGPQQQWQAPPQGQPYYNQNYGNPYGGGMPGGRPPKKNNTGLIVGIILALAAVAVVAVLAYGYFALGWFRNPLSSAKTDTTASSSASSSLNSAASLSRQYEERASSRSAEESLRQSAEEVRLSQLAKERSESYSSLKEKWDEASRQQQARVDEIMGRNRESESENTGGSTGGNTGSTSSPQIPVSGTWYGPMNEYTGDRSSVSLYPDGTGEVTIDMGAGDLYIFRATYSSFKNGPYEYDDIVCTVTLLGDTSGFGFPSNTFTFAIDPEVENGMYAYFVDPGFGMIPENSMFVK